MRTIAIAGGAAVLVCALSAPAAAFCGFYVSGAGAEMFNNATQVVLMRQGTRTVLSMQNNYQGPPESFAMVVPVPVVLQEDNVKTLPHEVFARVDKLGAPRLVEYWEEDPCQPPVEYDKMMVMESGAVDESSDDGHGVTIEAQFKVGEYEVVILSAKDSTGLDRWLKKEKYAIPEGAEPLLRPYVESGSKFFVAKVDVTKVKKLASGQLMLSPLRFHYDSDAFSLPIRLGLINSGGTQDLIVNVLAPGQRYEVANYDNAFIPTNIEVADETRARFAEFYVALLDQTLASNPGAVVTEYAWDASSCDPCPEPPLAPAELATLGADVLAGTMAKPAPYQGQLVLTRLHARYGKDAVGEDLVFKAAEPVVGGREHWVREGELERGAKPASVNSFQGRYIIRHPWTGPISCSTPIRGRWGGPPAGQQQQQQIATDLAFAPRGKLSLAEMVAEDIPAIGVTAAKAATRTPAPADPGSSAGEPQKKKGCGSCAAGAPASGLLAPLVLVLLGLRRRGRNEPA